MTQINRIKVSGDGTVVIRCPHCGIKRKVSVDKFRGKKHTLKPRCSCGKSFITYLDFRSNSRRQTDLYGTYNMKSNSGDRGNAVIANLSKNDICFTVTGIHNIQIGQEGLIDFVLDNRKSTRLTKEIIIKSVKDNRIGCTFDAHQPFEKDFEFYLQS